MALPVSALLSKDEFLYDRPHALTGNKAAKAYVLRRRWFRQAKPYDLPLYFDSAIKFAKSNYVSNGPFGSFDGSGEDASGKTALADPGRDQNIYNQAYSRFVSKMGEAVELGVATAEGRQAMSMLTRRFGQMTSFTTNLARGRFGRAAEALGIEWDPSKRKFASKGPKSTQMPGKSHSREAARSFSSLYLEAHFGWRPLISDIHAACEVFNKPIAPTWVKASASGSWKDPLSFETTSQASDRTFSEGRTGSYTQTVGMRGQVVIVNPNIAMMQQWGILNPASVAWELVPFSFVLDWFVNVGDYLGSLTDFAGLSLDKASYTTFTLYTGSGYKNTTPKPGFDSSVNTVRSDWTNRSAFTLRRTGLGTGPSIRLRAPKPWGISRGLAAASLLMQRFPRQEIDRNAISLARKRTAFRANVFPQFYGKYF